MAFPSIIESLVCGIKGRKPKTDKNGNEIKTTISEGFGEMERDLEKRRTKLVFQHRMHSEISKDPVNCFIQKQPLMILNPRSILMFYVNGIMTGIQIKSEASG